MKTYHKLFMLIAVMCFVLAACAGVEQKKSNASVAVEPLTASASDAIKVLGKGFNPNEEVDILFVLEETMKIGIGTEKVDVIKADANGSFSIGAAVPMNAKPGKYKIEVRGNQDSFTFTSIEIIPKKK